MIVFILHNIADRLLNGGQIRRGMKTRKSSMMQFSTICEDTADRLEVTGLCFSYYEVHKFNLARSQTMRRQNTESYLPYKTERRMSGLQHARIQYQRLVM
jgi:hypothetical protein